MAHIKTCVMWKDKSKQKGKSKGWPMEAMCHTLRGRTCDKEKVERNFSLKSSGSIRWERRGKEGKEKERK